MNDLITTETLDAKEVFAGEQPTIGSLIKQVEEQVNAFNGDVSTEEGRKEIASIAYKVARSKTALDDLGKDLVSGIKKQAKTIDERRKHMRDTLDSLKDRVRRPLTEYEEKEKARQEELKRRLIELQEMGQATLEDIPRLKEGLEKAQATVIDETWEPIRELAQQAKDKAVDHLTSFIAQLEKRDAERAELEALRKEKEEREAEERRRQQEQAQKEREEAIRKEEADKAEKQAAEAAKRERERIEAEQERQRKEEERRAANKKHRSTINNNALDALVAVGLSQDAAQTAVEAIARGQIPNVVIRY